ncbi:MAG: hypothetical protein WCL02_05105 [bacterium]
MKDKKQLNNKKNEVQADCSSNESISSDKRKKYQFFKYLFIFLIGVSFSLFFTNAFTLVKTNITNAVQVIKRTYFTNDGTLSGTTIVDINAGS